MSLEEKLRELGRKYDRRVLELKDRLLGEIATFLIKVKTKQGNGFRNFLFMVFVPRDESLLPEVLIYHDDRCAYCGKRLVVSESEAKCLVCGKAEEGGKEKLMCEDGHYLCEDCYFRDVGKTILPLVEVFVKHYKAIKERAKELESEDRYADLEPKTRFSLAFRNVLYSVCDIFAEHSGGKVELIPLTNILAPSYESLFLACLSKCQGNFCEPVKDVLKDLGVLED